MEQMENVFDDFIYTKLTAIPKMKEKAVLLSL